MDITVSTFKKRLCLFFVLLLSSEILAAEDIQPIGSRITIAAGSDIQSEPRAVFNPVTRQFFVTWLRGHESRHSIRARFVNLGGSLSKTRTYASANFILQGGLAYNAHDNRFIINYQLDGQPDTKILTSTGKVIKKGHNGGADSISYNPTGNMFLFLFGSLSIGLVGNNGTAIRFIAYPPTDTIYRDFAVADEHSTDFLVVAQKDFSNTTYFYRLSQNGIIKGSRKKIGAVGPADYVRNVVYNPLRNEILIVFWKITDQNFYTIRLNSHGKTLSTRQVAKGSANAYIDLANVGLTFANGNYLLVYDRDDNVYVKQIGALGGPASKEIIVGSRGTDVGVSFGANNQAIVYWTGSSDPSDKALDIYGQFLQVP